MRRSAALLLAAGLALNAGAETGRFFRVQQQDGRWWFITPAGQPFYLVGTDHVRFDGHWCEKLGHSPYGRAAQRIYGSEEAWATATVARLQAWGFNALTAGHSASLRHRGLPHLEFLSLGAWFAGSEAICPKTTWTGFPDVFSTNWARHCDERARIVCAPARNDTDLIGYFLDNELEWYGKSWRDDGLFDDTWKLPPDQPAKQAWAEFAAADLAAFNAGFGTTFTDAAALAADRTPRPPLTDTARALVTRWVRELAERYFRVAAEAVRRHDPNHLIVGCRFAGRAPGVWDIAGRHCDVVSVNVYPQIDVERGVPERVSEELAGWHRAAGRPLLLTEWSFPALDAGLPSRHGAGMRVDTQAQRARCFEHFQEFLFRAPHFAGSCYFMYLDEPPLGISSTFPEDSNYGLVSNDDVPWPELTAAAARLNPRAAELHRAGGFVPAPTPAPPGPPAALRSLPPAAPLVLPFQHTSGAFTVEGPFGGRGLRMAWAGQSVAEIFPRLHQRLPRDDWPEANAVQCTALREDARWRVVDLEFDRDGPAAFRVWMRYWLPRTNGAWLASQCLRVRNESANRWTLAGVFHYVDPVPAGDRAQVDVLCDIPSYYRPSHGWRDLAGGRGVGAWYDEAAPFACHFWKDTWLFHSDLREELAVELGPGESYVPAADPVYFFPLTDATPVGHAAAVARIAAQLRP